MIVDYISDIHINHWITFRNNQFKWERMTRKFTRKLIENKKGEVIIIAGDFSEFNNQSLWVLDELSKYYNRVYYTFGNHDLYLITNNQKKKYKDSIGRLNELISKSLFIKNVVPLIKTMDTYKGITFAGDAMWYAPQSLQDWSFYTRESNDSNYISIKGEDKYSLVKKLYNDSIMWYNELEDEEIDVFVSHVPPVNNPDSKYSPNGCYSTVVPYLVADKWVCGHQHEQSEFYKAGTSFFMNPLGYPSEHCFYPKENVIPKGRTDMWKTFGVKSFTVKPKNRRET